MSIPSGVPNSGVPFTSKFNNMHQGYETLHEATSVGGRTPRPGEERNSKSARQFVDRFLPWLERHQDVPFFAFFLHVMDPHDPFEPPAPYATMWTDPAKRAEHVRQHEEIRAFIEHPVRKDWGMPSVADLEEAKMDPVAYITYDLDWYDGSIRGLDAEIDRVFERLRELELAKAGELPGCLEDTLLEVAHPQLLGQRVGVSLVLFGPRLCVIPATTSSSTCGWSVS